MQELAYLDNTILMLHSLRYSPSLNFRHSLKSHSIYNIPATRQYTALSHESKGETHTQGVRGGCRASQELVGGLAGALPFDIVYR